MSEPIRGRWYDGHSSQARSVLVSLQAASRGPSLRLHEVAPPGRTLELGSAQVGWPESWSANRAPRTVAIDLREHGSLEVDDVAGWQAALAAAGDRPALAQRMQTRWPVFLAVLVVAAAALGAFYRWGTPWAATQVTRQVPLEWETALSQRALQDLDQSWLKPSKLPAARQTELRERFDALARQLEPRLQRYSGYTPRLSLSFRAGLGANAFALPGGAIVMTDGLVEAAAAQGLGDDALVGVLAHEIGHVVHRHTTRMVVEQAVLNVGLGLALGDVSSLVSIGGSLLTGLAYRRSHETEADCFAVALMRKAQLPTDPMADLLLAMDKLHKAAPEEGGAVASLLSSHPATALRARQLKQGRLEGC
ncbi:M48 family metallopeptidase [Caenimonas soli]|uniref:M48 family metallopeptidase n=1 Tax=Caenimonas soli TaxID=2735555 RepID=UPI0015538E3B|nr:M48 family metallopeptidase [Caenimonas soli]NPC56052.1 M48 family metallopeptidase [Caenimonas soli]